MYFLADPHGVAPLHLGRESLSGRNGAGIGYLLHETPRQQISLNTVRDDYHALVEPILDVRSLTVELPTTSGWIRPVNDVSFTLNQGETLGIVGESGSGKTTLGLAILRLIRSQGTILYCGRGIDGLSVRQMRPLRRDMQIVFQDPFGSLSPRLSVAEIVEEGLIAQKSPLNAAQRREAVARALADTGLDPATMDRYPHEFSGGQRQRIAIARAMALDPKVIVLDEPTSALDMSVQAQIVDLLRDLQKRRSLAYLFISHDLKVVRALASDVIVMRRGEVIESGSAREVFAAPREDYTKALFAAAFAIEADATGVVSQ